MDNGERFLYAGHSVGAAAHFHRLDETEDLDYAVPTLAASVLPVTGGVSKSHISDYCFEVEHPRRRTLLSARHIDTIATGKKSGNGWVTEVTADIKGISVVQKLRLEEARLHMASTRAKGQDTPVITTKGNRLDGLRLGKVDVTVVLDDEPLCACGSQEQLAKFYSNQTEEDRRRFSWRFNTHPEAAGISKSNGYHICTLVREIKLEGPEDEKQLMTVEGYTIRWKGFGRIILGEIIVGPQDRHLTLMRLDMGSDAGGSGSVGDGRSNGMVGS